MKAAHEEAPTEDVGGMSSICVPLPLPLLLSSSNVLACGCEDIRLPLFFLELYDDTGAPSSDSELRHDDDDDDDDDEHDAVDRYDCFGTLLPLLVVLMLDALDNTVLVPM